MNNPHDKTVLVKSTRNWITVKCRNKEQRFDFPIRWTRIDTSEKLLGWILHLVEKPWFTIEHVQQLIRTLEKRGVKVDWYR